MSQTLEIETLHPATSAGDELSERPGGRRRAVVLFVVRIAVVAGLLALWQYASGRWIDPFWVSSPDVVWARLQKLAFRGDTPWEIALNFPSTDLAFHLGYTFQEMMLGLLYGTLSGMLVGFLLGRNRFLGDLINPLIIAVYSLPKLALAPLFILWFGIGIETKIIYSAVIVFFLVFYNTFTGARDVDVDLVNCVRIFGANRLQILWKIVVPSALMWVFAGVKLAVPYSLVGAVVAEMMASNRGIGYLISSSANQFDTGGVFAVLAVLMIISTSINALVSRAESVMLRWKTAGG